MPKSLKLFTAIIVWVSLGAVLLIAVNNLSGMRTPDISKIKEKTPLAKQNENEDTKTVIATVALIADSHVDNVNLKKALQKIQKQGVNHIIGVGDYSAVGTREELSAAKRELDAAGIPYDVIPGDHDLWDNRNKGLDPEFNFRYVFNQEYKTVTLDKINFILVNNGDNYGGIDSKQWEWVLNELKQTKNYKLNFMVIHKPLYHPTSTHIMGQVSANVDKQRKQLLEESAKAGITEIVSGDLHFFSRYEEPVTHGRITIVGAVTADKNWQGPRYALIKVYDDYSYSVKDVPIEEQ